jgi:hypothetical protein
VFADLLDVFGKAVSICANRPDSAGCPVCVSPDGTCRNWARKTERRRSRTHEEDLPGPPDETVRYIPLTRGRFAIVEKSNYNAPFGVLITQADEQATDDPRIVEIPLASLLMMR